MLNISWLLVVHPLILWLHIEKPQKLVGLLGDNDAGNDNNEKSNELTEPWTWVDISIPYSDECDDHKVESIIEQQESVSFLKNVSILGKIWVPLNVVKIEPVFDLQETSGAQHDNNNELNDNNFGLSVHVSLSELIFVVLEHNDAEIGDSYVSGNGNEDVVAAQHAQVSH